MNASEARKLSDLFNESFDIQHILNVTYGSIKAVAESGATELHVTWTDFSPGVKLRLIDELESEGYRVYTRPCCITPDLEYHTEFAICWANYCSGRTK